MYNIFLCTKKMRVCINLTIIMKKKLWMRFFIGEQKLKTLVLLKKTIPSILQIISHNIICVYLGKLVEIFFLEP